MSAPNSQKVAVNNVLKEMADLADDTYEGSAHAKTINAWLEVLMPALGYECLKPCNGPHGSIPCDYPRCMNPAVRTHEQGGPEEGAALALLRRTINTPNVLFHDSYLEGQIRDFFKNAAPEDRHQHAIDEAEGTHHAMRASSEVVVVPRVLMEALREYWNGRENESAMKDALRCHQDTLDKWLAAPRPEAGKGSGK